VKKGALAQRNDAVLIVGVGTEFGADDRVGRTVAETLKQSEEIRGVEVREATGEGASLMALWEGYSRVIIIDAASSGSAPGTIHRIDASKRIVPTGFLHYSTHAFGVAEAIELARVLGTLPESVTVYAVEGACFRPGGPVTPEVEKAVPEVARQVREELAARISS